ncbi:MAG: DUF4199 domain-containing protein [Bacteroidia bacterium]|nr:DUF4199 domain-containing protein [Bacteroidia bacterium]MCZ2277681.1 DUF4199 domain-containing protein [Bacteroidia bacterium]
MITLPPRWRVALHYGALSGIGSFLIFIAIYLKGSNPLGIASWLGAWIPIVFICIATKYYRDRILGGFITYGNAFMIGVLTVFCASVLFALLIYIFGVFTNEAFIQVHIQETLANLDESKMFIGSKLYKETLERVENMTLGEAIYQDLFSKMVGGVIIALITAAYYRRKPDHQL